MHMHVWVIQDSKTHPIFLMWMFSSFWLLTHLHLLFIFIVSFEFLITVIIFLRALSFDNLMPDVYHKTLCVHSVCCPLHHAHFWNSHYNTRRFCRNSEIPCASQPPGCKDIHVPYMYSDFYRKDADSNRACFSLPFPLPSSLFVYISKQGF